MNYEARTFNVPELDGISKKTMDEHIGLYQGYVKNFNAIKENMRALMVDSEKNMHAISEMERRLSFEFGGMRLHEHYFPQLEGGAKPPDPSSAFAQQIAKEFDGNAAQPVQLLKNVASMRGPGWAILYWDPVGACFQAGFTGEQHQGHFVTLPILLALDVWEHAFILDYGAQGKGKYLEAFFKNLNWGVIEKRFEEAAK